MSEAKVIGLGGVFIKFNEPKAMNKWYKEVLGLNVNDYGILFGFNHGGGSRAFLQLGTFEQSTDYFGSEKQQVMLNFRVQNLIDLSKQLREKSVQIVDEIESYEYGKFLHINDPEGNRIELWEPNDEFFAKTETFQDMH